MQRSNLSLTGEVEYNKDDYSNSVFGLKDATNWAVNLDGTYAVSEAFSASAFYTYEDQHQSSAGASYSSGQITNAAFVGRVPATRSCQAGASARSTDKNHERQDRPLPQLVDRYAGQDQHFRRTLQVQGPGVGPARPHR